MEDDRKDNRGVKHFMPSELEQLELDLLRREKTLRLRAVILTLIPIFVAVAVLVFVGLKVDEANKQIAEANKQVEAAHKLLQAQQHQTEASHLELEKSGHALADILDITYQMQELIERKQSFLRTSEEAGFLISIRLMFDRINERYRDLGKSLPNLRSLDDRSWVTVLASSRSLADMRYSSKDWSRRIDKQPLAIYKAPNGNYALVIPGDGTFSFAYTETVLLKKEGSSGVYFAESKDWGNDYLQ